MFTRLTIRPRRRAQRGSALIAALVLVLVLTMVVTGAQVVTVQQLKEAKAQRDYEVALQMAEAGANAYLNERANKFVDKAVTDTVNGIAYMPPPNITAQPASVAAFRTQSGNGTIPANFLIHYPQPQNVSSNGITQHSGFGSGSKSVVGFSAG